MDRNNRRNSAYAFRSGANIPPQDILRLIAKPLPDGDQVPLGGKPAGVEGASAAQDGFPKRLITAKELALRLQVPVSWCWRAARQGTLPHYRCGQYIRFDLAEVLDKLRRGDGDQNPRP
ncbi:MAG: helix-turn-helix domain-containing protein [Firmicutes bacterium]|nr:helix-turn-helix domain-containing protein [Bacillota bacterium]